LNTQVFCVPSKLLLKLAKLFRAIFIYSTDIKELLNKPYRHRVKEKKIELYFFHRRVCNYLFFPAEFQPQPEVPNRKLVPGFASKIFRWRILQKSTTSPSTQRFVTRADVTTMSTRSAWRRCWRQRCRWSGGWRCRGGKNDWCEKWADRSLRKCSSSPWLGVRGCTLQFRFEPCKTRNVKFGLCLIKNWELTS